MIVKVMKSILQANEKRAQQVRGKLAKEKVVMINLIGSPGAGKTSLLEKTFAHFGGKLRCAVIEGDVDTIKDAERLSVHDVPVIAINTGGACHLESLSIDNALDELDLESIDIIIIENVGNLVCPAEFDLGESMKIAITSVPEGHDKPIKYPLLFQEAGLVILNKEDLIPHTDFDLDEYMGDVKKLNAETKVFAMSCRTSSGLEAWYEFIETLAAAERSREGV